MKLKIKNNAFVNSKKANSDCISLSCAHDSVHLEFDGNFFGVADGDVNSFESKFNTKFADGKFHINCDLGDCGMSVSTNDDGSELTYAIQVGTSRFGSL